MKRATVPEITGVSSKRQAVISLVDAASSAKLLGHQIMSDDPAMPVSLNLARARTSAIDFAAAANATKHTTDVNQT